MRLRLMSIGLSFGLAGHLTAQQPVQSVTGIVRDPAGALLPGATIQIGERSGTTNPQGAFRVDSLRPGSYLLTVRHVGYLPLRSSIIVVTGSSPRLEYVLQ